MSVLNHVKTLQHVSIITQIIFRELVGSLLKSLNLKVFIIFLKLWRLFVVMRQHNVWCVCVARATHTHRRVEYHKSQVTNFNYKYIVKLSFLFSGYLGHFPQG
jgi:hypothetical protein